MDRAVSRLQGKCISDLVFLEVFAGTGRLTASVRRLGMSQSVGIDHIIHKQVRAPMVKLDLTKASDFSLLMSVLDDEDVAWVHCAPPCGAASRARDIRRKDGFDPPAARSDAQPDGLANLTDVLQGRVQSANCLYKATSQVMERCFQLGIFSSTDPQRSYFWDTPVSCPSCMSCLIIVNTAENARRPLGWSIRYRSFSTWNPFAMDRVNIRHGGCSMVSGQRRWKLHTRWNFAKPWLIISRDSFCFLGLRVCLPLLETQMLVALYTWRKPLLASSPEGRSCLHLSLSFGRSLNWSRRWL